VNATDKNGMSAEALARSSGHSSCAKLLARASQSRHRTREPSPPSRGPRAGVRDAGAAGWGGARASTFGFRATPMPSSAPVSSQAPASAPAADPSSATASPPSREPRFRFGQSPPTRCLPQQAQPPRPPRPPPACPRRAFASAPRLLGRRPMILPPLSRRLLRLLHPAPSRRWTAGALWRCACKATKRLNAGGPTLSTRLPPPLTWQSAIAAEGDTCHASQRSGPPPRSQVRARRGGNAGKRKWAHFVGPHATAPGQIVRSLCAQEQ
jgi:hypothetical protein